MKKTVFLFGALSALLLTACNGGSNNSNTQDEPQEDENEVSVFVLSGQSNMEGNTKWQNNIDTAFQELGLDDVDVVKNGMPEVQTSFFGVGYGELFKRNGSNYVLDEDYTQVHSSYNTNNKEADKGKILGKFMDTKVGMGFSDSQMGPELGAAYVLRNHATAEKPIYFIKCAFSGSGFAQSGGNAINWNIEDQPNNLFKDYLVPYVNNNLKLIEDEGFKPVIKGWLWHQGESDTATEKITAYPERLGKMINAFRDEFADYAKDEDGENIAFIDGMIYQGSGTAWGAQTSVQMNETKKAFAESDDVPNTYLVDNYGNLEHVAENELKPGNPGGDNMHYCTKDSFRLGMGYANVIIDNDLL